jgi:hypothetical protein
MKVKEFTPDSISDEFWDAIAVAKQDYERFRTLVKEMNRGALIRFYWNYEEAAAQFKADPYLSVVTSVRAVLSEDTLDDICNWIVAQGKEYYAEVFYNPHLMPSTVNAHDPALRVLSEVVKEHKTRYAKPIPYRDDSFV